MPKSIQVINQAMEFNLGTNTALGDFDVALYDNSSINKGWTCLNTPIWNTFHVMASCRR